MQTLQFSDSQGLQSDVVDRSEYKINVDIKTRKVTLSLAETSEFFGIDVILNEEDVTRLLRALRLSEWAKRTPLSDTDRASALVVSSEFSDNHL